VYSIKQTTISELPVVNNSNGTADSDIYVTPQDILYRLSYLKQFKII